MNRISDRIRYPNTGIDPGSRTTRLQWRIYTRIMDYDRGILCFQVRAAKKLFIFMHRMFSLDFDFVERSLHEFEVNFVLGI